MLAAALAAALPAGSARADVTPDWGPAGGGTVVRLTGSFRGGVPQVSFAGVPAAGVRELSPTELTAVSPPGSGTVAITVRGRTAETAGGGDWFAYQPPPGAPWLGLNGNSRTEPAWRAVSPVDEFSRRGIVYDRSFDLTAGQSVQSAGARRAGLLSRLAVDFQDGMTPVVTIEFEGYRGNVQPTPYFPLARRTPRQLVRGMSTIAQYVSGFVASSVSLLRLIGERYPGMSVLLEPMNEPWGYTTPLDNGAEYARVLARLLPAARAAGIPLRDIYVCAFGADRVADRAGGMRDYRAGWIAAMYAAEPSLRAEIQGWYFHPYGPPSGTLLDDSWGIQSVPALRARMASGQDNIIVSEVGYCARSAGGGCDDSGQAEVPDEQQAAARLAQMLQNARPYSEAGWLRALIVYSRSAGGWSMLEHSSGRLDLLGRALERFAAAAGAGPLGESCPLGAGVQGSELSVLVARGDTPAALPGECPPASSAD